jgi:acyl-CoA dehydrogenase
MTYTAPIDGLRFALRHHAGLGDPAAPDGVAAPDDDTLAALLTEAGRFAVARMVPLYRIADREGARLVAGEVQTTTGFKALYQDWIEGGWNAVMAPEEHGGMALPLSVGTALLEIWTSANMAFMLGPVLTQAAVEVLLAHADEKLRAAWIEPLVAGTITATMALTEPQAGSDLGALRTRAEPAGDGTYRLFGQKIFISWGEHDLTENIVHLVLARLPDAAPGSKGISLFLVPKILPDGSRNDLHCTGIEHKLGIHGSPTCAMSFGDAAGAVGWLVGASHRGLACMFTMMNRARLATGMQGVAIAELACQQATAFAAERRQGLDEAGHPAAIDAHPDVRRMLRSLRAATLAGRAIAFTTAGCIDRAEHSHDPAEVARAALLTPMAKAHCGELGVAAASLNIQLHGGMGYVEETGAAQLLRDVRIVPIYEGTNGIQAIDLVQRKVRRDGGAAARAEIARLRQAAMASEGSNSLAGVAPRLLQAAAALEQATDWLLAPQRSEPECLANATAYLTLFATAIAGGYLAAALVAAEAEGPDVGGPKAPDDFAAITRFYAAQSLPTCASLASIVTEGAASVLES